MTHDELETRIVRLEKSARRWRVAACSLGLLVLAGLALGQGVVIGGGTGGMKAPMITVDKVVANKEVALFDSNNKARIVLSIENDAPMLQLKDKDENALLSLSVEKDAAHVLIVDAKGKKLFSAP